MTVHLVGAGPGDPGLLTVRGAEVLGRAEVVVYDRLSVSSLLDLAPAEARRISVGKAPGRPSMSQAEINALLVELGGQGLRVVRLKGGDPFVFARGGEEAVALAAAGVAYEVVPGITSAIAAPAYAGIPVTLRHSSTSFTVVTGHEDPAAGHGPDGSVDWELLGQVGGTLVILMGVANWPSITRRLQAGGMAGDTPVAAVRWGTRPEQHTVRATLATLDAASLAAPSVIVVGDVAGQHLDWFEHRPLFGRRVVVTRARAQAGPLAAALRDAGAEVLEVPVIDIVDAADGGAAVREAAATCADGTYDWVVCTSANGVERFCVALRDGRDLAGMRIAAVGPATAKAFARFGLVADLVPDEARGEGLVDAFPVGEGRVLFVRAEAVRDVVAPGLRAKGWVVDEAVAYRTVARHPDAAAAEAIRTADAVTVTSPSTVDGLVAAVGVDGLPEQVVSIGPVTSEAVRRHGLEPAAEADPHTVAGVVEAVGRVLGGSTPVQPRVEW